MSDNQITTIEEYLNMMTSMIKSSSKQKINRYVCFEDFVLQHGMRFDGRGKLPKKARMGKARQCFKNATQLVLAHPNLTYVEGYACGIIPVMHGWCVTKEGDVIDPTWKDGREYFGVPIKRSYLIKSMRLYGVYGIIDLWQNRWPIFNLQPEEFKELI